MNLLMIVASLLLILISGITAQDATDCRDDHEFCSFWSGIGECETNLAWMPFHCPMSCKICKLDTGKSQTCESLSHQSSEQLQEVMTQRKLVITQEDLTNRPTMTLARSRNENNVNHCVPRMQGNLDCHANMCYHMKFRTMDGTCNNLNEPFLGAAFRPLKRLVRSNYDDGIQAPSGSIKQDRPSPRDATRFLLSSSQVVNNDKLSAMLMQWGQFMSHDLSRTTLLPNSHCTSCVAPVGCFSVNVSTTDPSSRVFGCEALNGRVNCCIRGARSTPVCGTGTDRRNPREQYNENTAFMDASHIYGSSVEDLSRFRVGTTGFLLVTAQGNHQFPPFDRAACPVGVSDQCTANFQAGDDRANIFLGLAAMHTLFTREHNRIAGTLQGINPHWDGDRLFHETRKIVGALFQHITYTEWLPKILGRKHMNRVVPPYRGYVQREDPTIANSFTTATMRFGHGMINEFYERLNGNGIEIPDGGINFGDAVFSTKRLLFEGGVDPMIRGILMTSAKRPHRLTTSITERLFGSLDLSSINIERGRDHAIPSYNQYRHFCKNQGLARAVQFDDLSNEMLDPLIRKNLKEGYQQPDNVDLYVGLLLEDPLDDSMVGPTLICLLGDQFRRLRDGDRFFYENPSTFTARQLTQLKRSSLSRIICDNGDNFGFVPRDAFAHTELSNFTDCRQLPFMDLNEWADV